MKIAEQRGCPNEREFGIGFRRLSEQRPFVELHLLKGPQLACWLVPTDLDSNVAARTGGLGDSEDPLRVACNSGGE